MIITHVVGFCNQKLIQRKAFTSHPNSIVVDDDMISLFEKAKSKRMLLPRFAAGHYLSLPPGSGFGSIDLVLCFLREELSDTRKEISNPCESNSRDKKSSEDMLTVKQDVQT